MVLRTPVLVLLALTPLLWTGWGFYAHGPGPNPAETLEHLTGDWALNLLLATLAVRPLWRSLRLCSPFVWLRRSLGLMAFFYATLHLVIYMVLDLGLALAWQDLWADVLQRPFITLGMLAWLLLVPLALTSTTGWQRRLGRRWAQLHWLVYVATALGIVHYLWLVKKDLTIPLFYLAVFTGLMLWRSVFLHTFWRRLR